MTDHYHAVRGFTPALKAAVVADAEVRGISQNDIIVEVVSGRFEVEFEPSGYVAATAPKKDVDSIELRMPIKLRDRLRRERNRTGKPVGQIILSTLSDHYGLPYEPPHRRHGRVAAA